MFLKMREAKVWKKIDAIFYGGGIYRYKICGFGPHSCISKHQKQANSLILVMHLRRLQRRRSVVWKCQKVIPCPNTSMMRACGEAPICFCTSHLRKKNKSYLFIHPSCRAEALWMLVSNAGGGWQKPACLKRPSEIVCSWWPNCGCPPCTPHENFYIQELLFPRANNTDNCMRGRVICS